MEEKKSLMKTLIELAEIDGKLIEREYAFLWAIASQLGLSKEKFEELFQEEIPFNPPANEFERIIQFQRMVLMMSVDENASETEVNYVKEMGLKMGLNPMSISNVLLEMKNHPNHMIPPNVLIQIFQRHHN
ncbi:TerB family tellurite resistance protein [Putridiphycobacter roseus]|uniref:TerB family tellurite resistance protein n=1 Tax=Putridiphycobacter roseus TaxID=2219161 RepID=A0A2W1MXJ1_9FLAO|nr:TerB family tellurite resistance protein [Putridiphycobacter roseus]PZE16094.1 TerB family tellurite resistance protein [Putridiphycobacter roseus]